MHAKVNTTRFANSNENISRDPGNRQEVLLTANRFLLTQRAHIVNKKINPNGKDNFLFVPQHTKYFCR